jgi:hypothetical protein
MNGKLMGIILGTAVLTSACQSGTVRRLTSERDAARQQLVAAHHATASQREAYHELLLQVNAARRNGLRDGAASVTCKKVVK